MTSSLGYLALVGERYTLSPIILLGSGPLLIIGFIATEVSPGTADRWWMYGIVAAIAQVALAAVFGLLWLTIPRMRPSQSTPFWIFLPGYLLASQIRVATIVWGLDAFGLSDDVPYWARAVTSAFIFPVIFSYSAYGLEVLKRYRESREELIRSLITATADLDRQRVAVEALRDNALSRVDRDVSRANRVTAQGLDALEAKLSSGADVRPELAALLEESDRRWRRISHRTLQRANIALPPQSWREFVDVMTASRPISLVFLAVSSTMIFVLVFGRVMPLAVAGMWTGLWIAISVLIAWGVNEVAARSRRFSLAALLTGMGVLLASGVWLFGIPGLETRTAWASFAIHITNIVSAFIVGFAPAMARNRGRLLRALQTRLDASTIDRLRVESELVGIAEQLAARLHGAVRGQFLAGVLKLQQALDQSDTEAALVILDNLRSSLRAASPAASQGPTNEEVEVFLENWGGLVEISSNLSEVNVPVNLRGPINIAVMEAVNDAIRHAEADTIDIVLSATGGAVTLSVMNNGHPAPPSPQPGGGAQVFDRLASAGWVRSTSNGRTKLVVSWKSDGSGDSLEGPFDK